MELEGEIFRTRGRAALPLTPVIVRELQSSDLALLGAEKGSQAPAIKRISDRHHGLARNLAAGMSEGEAAVICGLSISRVSILKADPTFKELLEFYRADVTKEYLGLHERLANVAGTALDELQTRLEDEPEKITVNQLLATVAMGADRTGFGPQSSQTNVNVNVDLASRLQAARERVRTRTIEGKAA
jgi:hypothetical protein